MIWRPFTAIRKLVEVSGDLDNKVYALQGALNYQQSENTDLRTRVVDLENKLNALAKYEKIVWIETEPVEAQLKVTAQGSPEAQEFALRTDPGFQLSAKARYARELSGFPGGLR